MILDLFAGPGGWDCGARTLGLDPIGIELDKDACATRAAAGLRTIRADVSTYPLEQMAGKIDGLIASPPCQDFSLAGKKAGIDGERGQLMFTVPAAVETLRPRWVACEQVPPAVEWWYRFAEQFTELGYRCWVGVLNAADFGVPQTRRRAFLIASLDKTPSPPTPSHAKEPVDGLFGTRERWVSMADALGWGAGRVGFPRRDDTGTSPDGYRERDWRDTSEPAFALTEKGRSWVLADRQPHGAVRRMSEPAPTITASLDNGNKFWAFSRPATTVVGSFCPDIIAAPGYRTDISRQDAPGSIRITPADGLILQSFPPDWPVQGSKTSQWRQIGNACPPLLSQKVLECVI